MCGQESVDHIVSELGMFFFVSSHECCDGATSSFHFRATDSSTMFNNDEPVQVSVGTTSVQT